MKRCVRPIHGAFDKAMLDRIEMDVINVAVHIFLIPNNMIPKPVLPYPAAVKTVPFTVLGGETHLDSLEDNRNRHFPGVDDQMKMIRQYHPSNQFEPGPRFADIYSVP